MQGRHWIYHNHSQHHSSTGSQHPLLLVGWHIPPPSSPLLQGPHETPPAVLGFTPKPASWELSGSTSRAACTLAGTLCGPQFWSKKSGRIWLLVGSTCDTQNLGSSEELEWVGGRDVARTKGATIHTLVNIGGTSCLCHCGGVGTCPFQRICVRVSRHQGHDTQAHLPRLGFRQDLGFGKMPQGSDPIAAMVQLWDQQDPIKLPSPRAVVARARNCLPEQRSR